MRDARGTVTAEFAAVLPAVIVVLAVAIGGLQVAGEQLRLQAAAAGAARLFARGESASSVAGEVPGATIAQVRRGDLVCARAVTQANLGILVGFTLEASSCALGAGR
ncbi:MAG TPA: TadE family type IV pilus minor pilin [Galbitalea sp.]|nr:TadE family type IV pilus minor pilin [Galbitalea sp.]